jgi:hypothetical protein
MAAYFREIFCRGFISPSTFQMICRDHGDHCVQALVSSVDIGLSDVIGIGVNPAQTALQ